MNSFVVGRLCGLLELDFYPKLTTMMIIINIDVIYLLPLLPPSSLPKWMPLLFVQVVRVMKICNFFLALFASVVNEFSLCGVGGRYVCGVIECLFSY